MVCCVGWIGVGLFVGVCVFCFFFFFFFFFFLSCVCFFVCGVAWLGVYWFRCVVVCFVGCVCGDV